MIKKIIIIFLIINLILPLSVSVDWEDFAYVGEGIYGLNWSTHSVGWWRYITNYSMRTYNTRNWAYGHLNASSDNNTMPSNVTYGSIAFHTSAPQLAYFVGECKIENWFQISNLSCGIPDWQLTFIIKHYVQRGLNLNIFTGTPFARQHRYEVYLDSNEGTHLVWNSSNIDGGGGAGIKYIQLIWRWIGNDKYQISVYVKATNYVIDSDNIYDPNDLIENKSGADSDLYIWQHRIYQIYNKTYNSSACFLSQPEEYGWILKKDTSPFLHNYIAQSEVLPQLVTLIEHQYVDSPMPVEFIELAFLENTLTRIALAFNEMHIPIVGDLIYNVAIPFTALVPTYVEFLPSLLSIYAIFLMGIMIMGFARGQPTLIWDHIMSLFGIVINFINMIKDVIFRILTIVSNMPVVGWVISAMVAGIAIIYMIMS